MPWNAVVTAGILLVLMAGAWSWQRGVRERLSTPMAKESWQQIREQHPMPTPFTQVSELPETFPKTVVTANPFSPTRRQTAPSPADSPGGTGEPTAPPPQFVYKGRVSMGTKQRAVLEEIGTKKTYFLQVGQEVAGFKVLDITETQVVLSTPQSAEPLIMTLTPKEGK